MKISWPTAAVLIVALVVIGALYLAGPALGVPPGSHTEVVTAFAGLSAIALAFMRSLFTKDANQNGTPDILEKGLLVLLVCGAALSSSGCGVSALDASTRALGTAHVMQAEIVAGMERDLQADLDSHCGSIDDAAERVACAAARGEHWRRHEAFANASAETLDSLALGIHHWATHVIAGRADEDTPPLPVCQALRQLAAVTDAWVEFRRGEGIPFAPWRCPTDPDPGATDALPESVAPNDDGPQPVAA